MERRHDDDPIACQPDQRAGQLMNYLYVDESQGESRSCRLSLSKLNTCPSACIDAGVASMGCCLTILGNKPCQFEKLSDFSDIRNLLAQHVQKEHWYESTTVGRFRANWVEFRTDKPNMNVLQEWFHALGNPTTADEGKLSSREFGSLRFTALDNEYSTGVQIQCADPYPGLGDS